MTEAQCRASLVERQQERLETQLQEAIQALQVIQRGTKTEIRIFFSIQRITN